MVAAIIQIPGANGFQQPPSNTFLSLSERLTRKESRQAIRYIRNLPIKSSRPKHDTVRDGKRNDDNDESSIISSLLTKSPSRAVSFSLIMILCGAALGPFLDSFHSAFGVLQYDEPITAALWGTASNPALITAWWVPVLFGVAGWLIGWLYIIWDFVLQTDGDNRIQQLSNQPAVQNITNPSPPKILIGISIYTFQYWLSGVLVATEAFDRTSILNLMSLYAAVLFVVLDGSLAGFIVSATTALGGPLIEVGLLSIARSGLMPGGYHYNDLGETGFFPLWIIPVYFLGGPAVGTYCYCPVIHTQSTFFCSLVTGPCVLINAPISIGNLARGFWNVLTPEATSFETPVNAQATTKPGCKVCDDTRCVPCPNCDGIGDYTAMGNRRVKCTSCAGRGFVICRACFSDYDEDPYDIESIRERMKRMPD